MILQRDTKFLRTNNSESYGKLRKFLGRRIYKNSIINEGLLTDNNLSPELSACINVSEDSLWERDNITITHALKHMTPPARFEK